MVLAYTGALYVPFVTWKHSGSDLAVPIGLEDFVPPPPRDARWYYFRWERRIPWTPRG